MNSGMTSGASALLTRNNPRLGHPARKPGAKPAFLCTYPDLQQYFKIETLDGYRKFS